MPSTRNTPRATRSPPATSRPAPVCPEPPSCRPWTSPNGSTSVPPAVRTGRLTSIPTRSCCTLTSSASISSSPAAVVSRAHEVSPRNCSSTPPPTVASRRRTSTRPSRSPRSLSSCSPYRNRSFCVVPLPPPAVAQIVVPPSDQRRYGCTDVRLVVSRPVDEPKFHSPSPRLRATATPASQRSLSRASTPT